MTIFEELLLAYGWKKLGEDGGMIGYDAPERGKYVAAVEATKGSVWRITNQWTGPNETVVAESFPGTFYQSSYLTLNDVLGTLAKKHNWQGWEGMVVKDALQD